MTEFWVSKSKHWCEYCKVWLNDTISSRSTHENGMKHKDMVAKKLREMRHKGDNEKKEKEIFDKTWGSIEAKAKAQYEKDVAAGLVGAGSTPKKPSGQPETPQPDSASQGKTQLTGTVLSQWEPDTATGYMYNDAVRYYYDKKSGWYYGGDPAKWTESPPIPDMAKYRETPLPRRAAPKPTVGARPAASRGVTKVKADAHPIQGIGGFQFHQLGGKVGAARGLGAQARAGSKPEKAKFAAPKAAGKPMSKAEAEAQAKRDAARARVEKRTLGQFGLK